MGWGLYVLTGAIFIAILTTNPFVSGSEQSGLHHSRSKRNLAGLAPTSFEERRQKRNIRKPAKARVSGDATPNVVEISAPVCEEEGIVLIQGDNNYFMKCQRNPTTGGYFQIVYICPSEMRSVDDTTKCIPPADCSQCSSSNGGGGDYYTNNGNGAGGVPVNMAQDLTGNIYDNQVSLSSSVASKGSTMHNDVKQAHTQATKQLVKTIQKSVTKNSQTHQTQNNQLNSNTKSQKSLTEAKNTASQTSAITNQQSSQQTSENKMKNSQSFANFQENIKQQGEASATSSAFGQNSGSSAVAGQASGFNNVASSSAGQNQAASAMGGQSGGMMQQGSASGGATSFGQNGGSSFAGGQTAGFNNMAGRSMGRVASESGNSMKEVGQSNNFGQNIGSSSSGSVSASSASSMSDSSMSASSASSSLSTSESTSFSESSNVTSSSLFTSFETFVETITFDITTSETITTSEDFSQDTTLEQMSAAGTNMQQVSSGQMLIAGTVVTPDLATLPSQGCMSQGFFPLLSLGAYMECIPVPGAGFRTLYRTCPTSYVFDIIAGSCIHASAKDVLRTDLGYRLGPGPNIPPTINGGQPFADLSQFPGMFPTCLQSGNNPFGSDDRYYLQCSAPGATGILQRCPYGYYFNVQRLQCLSWHEIHKLLPINLPHMNGIKVSSASPMFVLPECHAAGTFAYPDYRFYYTCQSLEGSSLYFTQTLWQCPIGLFYNSMYRTCASASTFSGHQPVNSWGGVMTHWSLSQKMDIRSGIGVPIGSVPFHVPSSDKLGKFPLLDIKYYYTTTQLPNGNLYTKLYICHSGFFFSSRRGQCVPNFLHEYILAGSSYKLGVNLVQQTGMQLMGSNLLSGTGIGIHSHRLAKLSVGNPNILNDPRSVFGLPVAMSAIPFDLAPCLSSGFHATPDYRFYYTCLGKNPYGRDNADNSKEHSAEEEKRLHDSRHVDEHEEEEYIQTLYQCPQNLYYSDRYGFCVAPYLHHFIGAAHEERYLWGGHRIHPSLQIDGSGMEWQEEALPWEIPSCPPQDGKFAIRDPRYYFSCTRGMKKTFLCPTNSYFNQKTGTCTPIAQCNCWYQVGYVMDPYPSQGIGLGNMNIQIHLDRSYLQLLRKMSLAGLRRATLGGRRNGRDLTLLKRLICFWREMEKMRTLKYPNTQPQQSETGNVPLTNQIHPHLSSNLQTPHQQSNQNDQGPRQAPQHHINNLSDKNRGGTFPRPRQFNSGR